MYWNKPVETMPREDLQRLQLERLQETVRRVYQHVPVYRERMQQQHVCPEDIRTLDDVRRLLNAGADKVSFNSAAVANPQLIADASHKYGAQCIVVAIDAKAQPGGGWHVYTHGGRRDTGLDALAWAVRMACCAPMPSFREASIWRVEVMNGAFGFEV